MEIKLKEIIDELVVKDETSQMLYDFFIALSMQYEVKVKGQYVIVNSKYAIKLLYGDKIYCEILVFKKLEKKISFVCEYVGNCNASDLVINAVASITNKRNPLSFYNINYCNTLTVEYDYLQKNIELFKSTLLYTKYKQIKICNDNDHIIFSNIIEYKIIGDKLYINARTVESIENYSKCCDKVQIDIAKVLCVIVLKPYSAASILRAFPNARVIHTKSNNQLEAKESQTNLLWHSNGDIVYIKNNDVLHMYYPVYCANIMKLCDHVADGMY